MSSSNQPARPNDDNTWEIPSEAMDSLFDLFQPSLSAEERLQAAITYAAEHGLMPPAGSQVGFSCAAYPRDEPPLHPSTIYVVPQMLSHMKRAHSR